ncbi:MAG: PAS domain-containing protein, partial [Christensenellaceae bacterium]
QLLTDSIPGGLAVYEYSLNGFKNLYFSDGVCEMIGYTRDEYRQMTKDNFLDMIFEEDLPLLRDKIHQVIVGSSAIDCVYRLRTKSDGYRWMNLRGTVADRRDDMIRVNAVLFDITDAKESEEKLRIRDEEYSLAIKQSGKRVYRYTLSDRSLYMLQKSIDLFELSSYEKNVPARIVELGFIAPESVNDCMAFYDAIFRGVKSGCTILRCKLKNGGFGWCSAHFTTIFNSNGDPVSAVVSIEDITKQHEQELENQVLRQNEELFQVVVSHSDRFIMKYDIKTQTAYVPPRTALAFSIEEVLHNVPYCCVEKEGIAEESIQVYVDFYEKLISGEATAEAIVKRTRNGHFDQWGWYRFDGSVIFDDTNKPVYAVVSFVEVTEQYERELAYERMSQYVNRLSKDAMLYFEANLTEMKIESSGGYWLSNIQQRLDAEPLVLLETAINDLIYSEDRDAIRFFFDKDNLLIDFAANKTEKEAECRILQDNQPKWVQVTVEMIADPYTEN